ncbi:hypothetical protein WOLCODRAFT_140744 [Wolfiporia cocos MD-104 SS10]|uniref:Uncharacterized protein n=1 Tax=Wolfiporia cocos (strain MD-104) TaxID=742152 RepID=A0A2H3J664_WOLCO|nr:hypothetical protein WOLCODRAFT_140744 [Wolfiporia cocos MD-104 SS10]
MAKRPRTSLKKPVTPTVRRFLHAVFSRPPLSALSTQARSRTTNASPQIPQPPPQTSRTAEKPACIALQNEDRDEDAIVITALNVIPFCCHADLLMMSRAELLAVATTLNAKLPQVMHIDVGPVRSDTYIRNAIELLVGLRHETPNTPLPVKSISMYAPGRMLQSPDSPLETRDRSAISAAEPVLKGLKESLDEEAEEPERPQKKRRYHSEEGPGEKTSTPVGVERRVTRSQSQMHSTAAVQSKVRVLRARSQRIAEKKAMLGGYPDVTVNRGHSSARKTAGQRSQSAVLTSTPKRSRILVDADVNSIRGGRGRASAPMSLATGTGSPSLLVMKSMRMARGKKGAEESIGAGEVTFGIDGLTVAHTDGDSVMDITME